MICPKCSTNNSTDSKFCNKCGTELAPASKYKIIGKLGKGSMTDPGIAEVEKETLAWFNRCLGPVIRSEE